VRAGDDARVPAGAGLRAHPDDLDEPAVLARLRSRGVEVIEG